MIIRTILDALRNWGWSLDYLTRQKRSEPRMYARMGRYREASHLWPDDEGRWDLYLRESDKPKSTIMDESGFSSGAAIDPKKDCL